MAAGQKVELAIRNIDGKCKFHRDFKGVPISQSGIVGIAFVPKEDQKRQKNVFVYNTNVSGQPVLESPPARFELPIRRLPISLNQGFRDSDRKMGVVRQLEKRKAVHGAHCVCE